MPKQNPYYIPKEYKKTEEVREIDSKYEIPTFEEFMRDYKSPVNYADLNSADIGTQKSYGPGNTESSFGGRNSSSGWENRSWGSRGNSSSSSTLPPLPFLSPPSEESAEAAAYVGKVVAKGAAAVALTSATGGLAPLIGGGMWIGGEWLKSTNSDFLNYLGKNVSDIGLDTLFSGSIGEVAKKTGVNLTRLESFFEAKGSLETSYEVAKHGKHKSQGINYKSNCEVCNL